MTVLPLLSASLIMNMVAVVFVICSVALILIVLIQKGRGGGLSGAFGGGMASGILGSKTGDFLTWATIVLAGVFLFVAVILAKFYRPTVGEYGTAVTQQTAPAESQQSLPADYTPVPSESTTPALPEAEQPIIPNSPTSNDSNAQTSGS